jgi:homoserine dehydrogenase
MPSPRLRIGLIGWGTVGSALGALITEGPLPLELSGLAVRDATRERIEPLPGAQLGTPDEVIEDASVVVELAGGIETPLAWARAALGQGKAFVTANKALLATHGGELAALAGQRQAALLGSASVGGGVPMIETVQHLAAAGSIERLSGLLNATTTFILSRMGDGASYEDALRDAQRAGYAEADPALDVDGRDAAQKLAILASVAWGAWQPETAVDCLGIVGLRLEPGRSVRLVAEATPQRMTVRPMELPVGSPFHAVSGVESILEIDAGGAGTFRVSGPGAGGRATAGAVYADLARLVAGERPILFGGDA